ncbi:MAG: hypothetical protein KGZ25_05170, partial [Planctomycetes bacterium]|nr:hypothetical protein [Planctomycetota bacterium]
MPHVKRIGIIVDMARSYSRKMFQGALTYAREVGDVRFATHPAYPDFDELGKCDGAIVQAFNQGQANVVSSYDMPLVWVLSCPEYTPNPVLKPNDREVGKLVANYLIERGYRNLAYVTSNPNAEFSRLRFEG